MKLSYKYRIYPDKQQQEILQKNFSFCCFLYNSALQERKDYYKKYGTTLSYYSQSVELPEVKGEFSEQTETIYAQSLQNVLKRLDRSYRNFFRRVKLGANKVGFPRWKSIDRFKSICFPQSDLGGRHGIKLLLNNKLKIFGLPGEMEVVWHRPIHGRCKTVTIKQYADGKYYIILSCDDVPAEHLPKTGNTIGIDLGITSFITTDLGDKILHPRPYKTAKEKLAYLNQKLAAKQRGSKNRKKAKFSLARGHQKVSDIRNDFLHKTTLQLVKDNDIIVIEKLNVKGMMEDKGFAVSKSNIADASWATLCSYLVYKAERAGKLIIEVDPRNTSKTCSNCGSIKDKLSLSDREYQCEACGSHMDRDQNAAINIKRLGINLAPGKLPQKSLALC